MPLTPGGKLGIYEIVAPLGAGGMGEVYRARDTRLGRDVAIKALPPRWSGDGRWLRFAYAGDNTTVYAADVLPGAQFRLGAARVLARFPETGFDVDFPRASDRLLLLVPARPLPPQSITFVQDWQSLLVRK